jgi:hypothetical protein
MSVAVNGASNTLCQYPKCSPAGERESRIGIAPTSNASQTRKESTVKGPEGQGTILDSDSAS